MESLANRYLAKETVDDKEEETNNRSCTSIDNTLLQLQSISVMYMSTAVNEMELQCGVLHKNNASASMRVHTYGGGNGIRPVSEGCDNRPKVYQ